ncbi:MBL fold metallo-hydrolase [Bacteroidota bacterium]
MKLKIVFLFLIPAIFLHAQEDLQKPYSFEKIGEHIYKIEVDVNSIIASVGPDGVLLCDVGGESKGPRLLATIQRIGGKKPDCIINTHWHVDHTGANICFGKDALIIAHENVRKTLSQDRYLEFWDEEQPAFPEYALPDITFTDRMSIHFNGEEIEIIHIPAGHTNGDAIVYFKQSNVLHVGDSIFSNGFPAIDFETGGSVKGFADNLKLIAEMMPPDVRIIIGHGPDYTIKDVQDYEKMVRSSINIVSGLMKKGMSVAEMQKANLLSEWEDYAHGFFTSDEWISIIYHSLVYNSSRATVLNTTPLSGGSGNVFWAYAEIIEELKPGH